MVLLTTDSTYQYCKLNAFLLFKLLEMELCVRGTLKEIYSVLSAFSILTMWQRLEEQP